MAQALHYVNIIFELWTLITMVVLFLTKIQVQSIQTSIPAWVDSLNRTMSIS